MNGDDVGEERNLESPQVLTDKYGFLKTSKDANVSAEEEAPRRSLRDYRREMKWARLSQDAKKEEWTNSSKREKIKERCRKGIPESSRGWAWAQLCGSTIHKRRMEDPTLYQTLSSMVYPDDHPLQPFLDIIKKDRHRTFPHHRDFVETNGSFQDVMERVLRAYAGYNPELGYCQGMSFITGTMVMYMLEEDAFWCLVCLLEKPMYMMGFFEDGLREIQIMASLLPDLLREQLTRQSKTLATWMTSNDVIPILFCQEWFMCCFVKTLPWDSLVRVWDMFFCEGRKVLFRAALAMLLSNSDAIRAQPSGSDALMFLRALPRPTLLPGALVPAMLRVKFKRQHLETLREQHAALFPAPARAAPRPSQPSQPSTRASLVPTAVSSVAHVIEPAASAPASLFISHSHAPVPMATEAHPDRIDQIQPYVPQPPSQPPAQPQTQTQPYVQPHDDEGAVSVVSVAVTSVSSQPSDELSHLESHWV